VSGWEFKELWTVSRSAGGPENSRTPVDEVSEEYGVGTPKWDPELEAQYHRRVAKALSWKPIPGPLSSVLEKQFQLALSFFQEHPGLHPRMKEAEFRALQPGAPVWTPPVHSEGAAPERLVLGCVEGPDKGDWFPLRARGLLLVGRLPECEWQLHDPNALDRQFQLKVSDESVLLRDLGGGTAINGEKPGERTLVAGDIITFGWTALKVVERKSTPPEPPAAKESKKKSSWDIWGEAFPDASRALDELNRRAFAETAPLYAAHKERIRPLVEQKERSIAAAKAAHDDMVRPLEEEFVRVIAPLRAAYGKADSDLADEAMQPFREKLYRAKEPARKMLKDAEKAANDTYKAQVRPYDESLAREIDPLRKRHDEERAAIMNSTKTQRSS
jgi:hypothetical protein